MFGRNAPKLKIAVGRESGSGVLKSSDAHKRRSTHCQAIPVNAGVLEFGLASAVVLFAFAACHAAAPRRAS
jgi:hypothetical protein